MHANRRTSPSTHVAISQRRNAVTSESLLATDALSWCALSTTLSTVTKSGNLVGVGSIEGQVETYIVRMHSQESIELAVGEVDHKS